MYLYLLLCMSTISTFLHLYVFTFIRFCIWAAVVGGRGGRARGRARGRGPKSAHKVQGLIGYACPKGARGPRGSYGHRYGCGNGT